MRRTAWIALVLFAVTSCDVGSPREKQAVLDEVEPPKHDEQRAFDALVVDIERFAMSNALIAPNLPLDVGRFVEWRKRELWHFSHALAWNMLHEWENVERLTKDVARYYGYNVINFPRANEDILRFFQRADLEWRNLVLDVMITIEYKDCELYKMEDDLRRFYQHVDWEIGNLDVDVAQFIEWRGREYRKLVRDGREWFALEEDNAQKLQDDVRRFRLHAAIEGQQLAVDFRNWNEYEHWVAPRLI